MESLLTTLCQNPSILEIIPPNPKKRTGNVRYSIFHKPYINIKGNLSNSLLNRPPPYRQFQIIYYILDILLGYSILYYYLRPLIT